MTDERLHDLLVRAGDDGRARAELETWPLVRSAFERERPQSPPARRSAKLAFAAAVVAAVIIAVASAGSPAALAHWLRDTLVGEPGVKHSAPALTHLPSGGRLLVGAKDGVWVVQPDGSRRLLRGYSGATWSPRGLYVGAWKRHELVALEPDGRVHWSLARPGLVRAADWSPDGYRIAYLAGPSLRVVAGDGTGDRELRAHAAPVPPAWRPRSPHMLLFAPRPHVLDLVATDVRTVAWRHQLPTVVRAVAWAADGSTAAAAAARRVTILDGATGRERYTIPAANGSTTTAIAFANRTRRLAIATRSRTGRARVLVFDTRNPRAKPHVIFVGTGSFTELAWSPDDRRLLIPWPDADQWLFVKPSRVAGIRAVSDIARQFDPGARRASFPRVAGWCCG